MALDVFPGVDGDSRMRRLWLLPSSGDSGVRDGVNGSEGELGWLFDGFLAGPGNQSCSRSLPCIPVFSSSLVQSMSGCQHKEPLKEFSVFSSLVPY